MAHEHTPGCNHDHAPGESCNHDHSHEQHHHHSHEPVNLRADAYYTEEQALAEMHHLFDEYIAPWLHPDANARLRPDVFALPPDIARPIDIAAIQVMDAEQQQTVRDDMARMWEAAQKDYAEMTGITDGRLPEVLDIADAWYGEDVLLGLHHLSDAHDYSNLYLLSVCELGLLMAHVLMEQDDFGWLYSYPYFDSVLVHRPTGHCIPVFDWAVKKLSPHGLNEGLLDKVKHTLHNLAQA
jgi:hypothetical protein